MLVGIAIDEGAINSTNDPITMYILSCLESDEQIKEVSLANLLMMQSGFYYRDHFGLG